MNTLTAKIAQQSKVILILVKIARILVSIAIGIVALLLFSTWIPSDEMIFRLGNTKVFASVPVQNLLGLDIRVETAQEVSAMRVELIVQLLALILSQVMLVKIARLFSVIRDNGNPFTADIAQPMKAFAVLLGLLIGVQSSILGIVVALVIFAFALIFQYGAQLQNQVDETL